MPIYKTKGKLIYFAHVPKCAGTSVEEYLENRLGKAAFLDRRFLAAGERWSKTSPQHIDAESLDRLFPRNFFDEVFTVVRHPADRILSAFYFQRDVEKTINRDAVFSDWLVQLQYKLQENQFAFDNHFRKQSELIPKRCRVFRLEDGFNTLMEYLDEVLGERVEQLEIGKFNSNIEGRKGKNIVISASDHKVIENLFRSDYETFGYNLRSRKLDVQHSAIREYDFLDSNSCIAIKIPPESEADCKHWGEYHFAVSLMDSFLRTGISARIDFQSNWYSSRTKDDIELVIRGTAEFEPNEDNPCIYWLLYPADNEPPKDMLKADFAYVASNEFSIKAAAMMGESRVSVLLQCTDSKRFSPDNFSTSATNDVVFVGLATKYRKNKGAVAVALKSGTSVAVWGRRWWRLPAADWKGEHLPNTELGKVYASAKVILNDHLATMRKNGFVNNRIYDVLASGTPVVTDRISGIPKELRPYVYIYDDESSMRDAIERSMNESEKMAQKRHEIADFVRAQHSFDARAREILNTVQKLIANRPENRGQIIG